MTQVAIYTYDIAVIFKFGLHDKLFSWCQKSIVEFHRALHIHSNNDDGVCCLN